jgi:hypothetical protein
MSLCARGALSRTLRLGSLRSTSRSCSQRLTYTIYSRCGAATPSINISSLADRNRNQFRTFSSSRRLKEQADIENLTDVLPICCPGCGAFSQTIEPDEPGYYSASRKQTRKLLASKREAIEQSNAAEDATSTNTEQGCLGEDAQPTAPIPMQGWFPNTCPVANATSQLLINLKAVHCQMMPLYPTTTHYNLHRVLPMSAIAATT